MILERKHWQILARNDWQEIIDLSKKKSFQRKFQIINGFISLVGEKGLHNVTHLDIARKCKITRQLVDHHFPVNNKLILMAYYYIYARFQKVASDAVMSQSGNFNRLKAYINGVSKWVFNYNNDARFLAQFFAVAPLHRELEAAHERNLKIGHERIIAILSDIKAERRSPTKTNLQDLATSLQLHIAGFVVLISMRSYTELDQKRLRTGMLQNCLAILHISGPL